MAIPCCFKEMAIFISALLMGFSRYFLCALIFSKSGIIVVSQESELPVRVTSFLAKLEINVSKDECNFRRLSQSPEFLCQI